MDDDWYRATTRSNTVMANLDTNGSNWKEPGYMSDEAASPLGCIQQQQWCNLAYPKDRGCGPLAGHLDSVYGEGPLFNLTDEDMDKDSPTPTGAAATRMNWHALMTFAHPVAIINTLRHLGPKSLISQTKLYAGVQFPLPRNQWQLDVANW